MGGLGSMSLGVGPYGSGTPPLPTEPITTAVSCRAIDGVTRAYLTDADGNAVGMDGTANRVYILLSYADTVQAIITAQGVLAREAAIRRALEPLSQGQNPAISRLSVKVTDAGGDGTLGTVTYYNNLTQTLQSVVVG